jgi:hypothetical protein
MQESSFHLRLETLCFEEKLTSIPVSGNLADPQVGSLEQVTPSLKNLCSSKTLEACNQKYCWKNTNYPQTNPGIKKISS